MRNLLHTSSKKTFSKGDRQFLIDTLRLRYEEFPSARSDKRCKALILRLGGLKVVEKLQREHEVQVSEADGFPIEDIKTINEGKTLLEEFGVGL